MKTRTILLIGGGAVLGYLYVRKRATAATTAQAQQAVTAQRSSEADDDIGAVMPGWTWGAPSWGSQSWGAYGRRH